MMNVSALYPTTPIARTPDTIDEFRLSPRTRELLVHKSDLGDDLAIEHHAKGVEVFTFLNVARFTVLKHGCERLHFLGVHFKSASMRFRQLLDNLAVIPSCSITGRWSGDGQVWRHFEGVDKVHVPPARHE